jgi:hypothetical protein
VNHRKSGPWAVDEHDWPTERVYRSRDPWSDWTPDDAVDAVLGQQGQAVGLPFGTVLAVDETDQ